MKICVWKTGHEIADTVAEAVYEGLTNTEISDRRVQLECSAVSCLCGDVEECDAHIGYGILRGMGTTFKRAGSDGRPWFNIDRGYWKPSHYDGYYRISLRGTQQTSLANLKPDYDRLDKLGLEILEPIDRKHFPVMLCPPTDYACQFFGIDPIEWEKKNKPEHDYFLRQKDDMHDLQSHLDGCSKVITFNSAVGWEALRQGIEVISDPVHSICGAYQKMLDNSIHNDFNERRKLFAIQASLQRSLTEIREGQLWPLLQTLLNL